MVFPIILCAAVISAFGALIGWLCMRWQKEAEDEIDKQNEIETGTFV